MKQLSKQQKIFLGVLGAAGCALVVDRLFIGGTGPASASAESLLLVPAGANHNPVRAAEGTPAQGQGRSPSPGAGVRLAGARSAGGTGYVPVADRLLMLSLPTDSPLDPGSLDAFRVPASWGDPFAKPEPGTAKPIETAQRNFKLTTVVRNRTDDSLIAVINGRNYKVGDVVDSCTVIGLTPESASLRTPAGGAFELRIQRRELNLTTRRADGKEPDDGTTD